MNSINQLVILAGGKGTRLKDETRNTPKPLVRLFDSECILGLLIDRYLPECQEIVVLAGYKSEQVEAYVSSHYPSENVRVLCEEIPAGTAGSLLLHREELANEFVVINGDTWFENDLQVSSLKLGSCLAGMVLTEVSDASRYGAVEAMDSGIVTGFIEKNVSSPGGPSVINAGMYLFSRQVLDFIDAIPCSLEQDVFPRLLDRQLLTSWTVVGRFLDIGVPETLEFARLNKGFFHDDI